MPKGGGIIDTCPLIAVYDLSSKDVVSEFFEFLVSAESYRTLNGNPSIHLIIGPSDILQSPDIDDWRLYSVLLPSLALLPSVASYTLSGSRMEIQMLIDAWRERGATKFFTNHGAEVDADRSAIISAEAARLQAPDHAKQFVQEWQREVVGKRRILAVTIPDHSRKTALQFEPVAGLLAMLDMEQWYVVALCEDAVIDLPISHPLRSIPIFEAANHNLEIRFAFYEAAFLNVIADIDSGAMCNANPDIRFIMLNAVEFELRNAADYRRVLNDVLSVDDLRVAFEAACRAIEIEVPLALVSGTSPAQQSMSLDEAYRLARKHQLGGTKHLPTATKIYKSIVGKDPNRADAWAQLGAISARLRQFEAAIHFFERALALRPDKPSYHFHIGKVLSEVNRCDLSLSFLRRATDLEPNFFDAWSLIARIERGRGNNEVAADSFAAAISVRTSQGGTGQIWIDYGDCLNDLGRTDEAIEAYHRGLRRNILEEAEHECLITMCWPWTRPVYPLTEAQFILSYKGSQADGD